MSLTLTRKPKERIAIDISYLIASTIRTAVTRSQSGESLQDIELSLRIPPIDLEVKDLNGGRVSLGFDAPRDVSIWRRELSERGVR